MSPRCVCCVERANEKCMKPCRFERAKRKALVYPRSFVWSQIRSPNRKRCCYAICNVSSEERALQAHKFCPECGQTFTSVSTEAQTSSNWYPDAGRDAPFYPPGPIDQQQVPAFRPVFQHDRKSPGLAGLLSVILVGLGHFYIQRWWRGLSFMLLAIIAYWGTI